MAVRVGEADHTRTENSHDKCGDGDGEGLGEGDDDDDDDDDVDLWALVLRRQEHRQT